MGIGTGIFYSVIHLVEADLHMPYTVRTHGQRGRWPQLVSTYRKCQIQTRQHCVPVIFSGSSIKVYSTSSPSSHLELQKLICLQQVIHGFDSSRCNHFPWNSELRPC